MGLKIYDLYILRKSFYYPRAQNTFDPLPIVYGDMSLRGKGGLWKCPYIDTTNFIYMIADHSVLSTANGNVFIVYKDGVQVTSGYTITSSGSDAIAGGSGKTISYIQFSTDQGLSEITVRCKGKNSGATLIENPISILEDFLYTVGYTVSDIDTSRLERARTVASDLGYKAAGVINKDASVSSWLNEILLCFLGDFWVNQEGKIVITLDVPGESKYNIAGVISERYLSPDVEAYQDLSNLCNQVDIDYSYNFSQDKFEDNDPGDTGKDILSQNFFGIYKRKFQFKWIRSSTVINTVKNRIITRFSNPVWIVTCSENSLRNVHVERGDWVLFSWDGLMDKEQLPLVNQIFRVMEVSPDLDNSSVKFTLIDEGVYWTRSDRFFDGSFTYNGSILYGGERERRALY